MPQTKEIQRGRGTKDETYAEIEGRKRWGKTEGGESEKKNTSDL